MSLQELQMNPASSAKQFDMAPTPSNMSSLVAASTVAVTILAATLTGLYPTGKPTSLSALIWSFWLLCIVIARQCVWPIFIYPRFSPFSHIPAAPQEKLGKRLLKEPTARDFEKWINEVPNDGLIRYYGIFNQERFLLTSPEGIKDLTQVQAENNIKGGPGYRILDKILPYGLVTVNEPNRHRFQRRLIQPAFKHKNVRDLYPIFWAETQRFISILENHLSDEKSSASSFTSLNIFDWISRATMDLITLTAFGGSYHALENPDSDLMQSWETFRMNDPQVQDYAALSFIFPDLIWRRLPIKQRYRLEEAVNKAGMNAKSLIVARRKALASRAKGTLTENTNIKIDIISTILKSPQTFTDDQLTGQALTFLLAGHDTTATALTWSLYLLSKNPSIQTRLRNELRSKVPSPLASDNLQHFDFSSLESLPYLNAVINESLRLFAPIPHIRRQISKPNAVVLGIPVPVGTSLYSSPWALNRSKAVWGADSLKFKPERYIDSKTGEVDPTGGATDPYAIYTFGRGPRSCIGEQFARSELFVMLTGLVCSFEFKYLGKAAAAASSPPDASNAEAEGDEVADADESSGNSVDVLFGVVSKPAAGKLWLGVRKLEGW